MIHLIREDLVLSNLCRRHSGVPISPVKMLSSLALPAPPHVSPVRRFHANHFPPLSKCCQSFIRRRGGGGISNPSVKMSNSLALPASLLPHGVQGIDAGFIPLSVSPPSPSAIPYMGGEAIHPWPSRLLLSYSHTLFWRRAIVYGSYPHSYCSIPSYFIYE